jgi:transposase
MQDTTIAVDVAKSVFEVAVSHQPGKVAARHRFTRQRLARFLAEQPPATVVMEACGMAHHWGREAQARGHVVRLLPPRDVRPYVRGNKTDR